nr:RNA polymerase I termination factor-like [Tanacetum cinerariifolium]
MGKPREDGDASPVTMGKKSKKNKNKINDLPDVDGDGNSQVEIDDALPKEKKGHEEKKKKNKNKKKSESNEDGVEDRPDKGDLVDDADLGEKKTTKKKKRESGTNEDGVEDRPDKGDLVDDADLGEKKTTMKKKRESGSNEDGVADKGNLVDDADLGEKKTTKKKKRESGTIEDGVEDRPDKGDLVDDADLGEKKTTKKKKRESGTIEDGVEDRPDKGDLVDDADLGVKKTKKKKRESGSNEDGVEDQPDKSNLVNDGDVSKKDKKKKRKRDSSKETQIEENEDNQNDGPELSIEDNVSGKSDDKKRKFYAQNSDSQMKEIMTEESTPERQDGTEDGKGTKEKKRTKVKGSKAQNKTTEPVENNTGKAKAKGKGKSKKVSFSGHVEVFPSSDTGPENQTTKGDGLIRGKRFTPEEDEIIKDAVNNYITDNNLGDDGLLMVMNCSQNRIKKCWQEIGKCIPYRPHSAVYNRAHILFERSEAKGFTPEEDETLTKYVQMYGHKWKKIGELMGKHRVHVKDNWRRIKLENPKTGKWTQEEYQTVYDLVNTDLKMRVHCEKKSKHGMLKDNIPWGAISEKLSTRSDARCCVKWYKLRSSLVDEGLWSDADDYWMIGKLYELDAACVDDVDWDNLLEHRPGDICRKRWDQMVKHIGDYGSKPFAEQVDVLAERYSPDLAETREAWDNKPVVP